MSARATAMGGSLGASANDAAMLDANPAGLAGIGRIDLQASYLSYFEDSSLQSFTAGFPFRMRPDQPGVPKDEFAQNRLGIGFEYRQFQAEDRAYTTNDIPENEFTVKDQLIQAGLSYAILPHIALGATAKSVNGKIQGKTNSISAFDLGAIGRMNRWSTGLALQNLGNGKKFSGSLGSAEYGLPMMLRASVSYQLRQWLAVADVTHGRDKVTRKSTGLEWTANKYLRFRGGFFHTDALEFTGGLGIDIPGPLKTIRESAAPRTRAKETPSNVSPMAQQIISRSVGKMSDVYRETRNGVEKPTLAVMPLTSKEKAGPIMRGVVERSFKEMGDFYVITAGTPTEYIVSGSVESDDERYTLNTRLIRMEDGETIATDHVEIATEDFYAEKKTLTEEEAPAPSTPAVGESDRVNLALDYGLATNKDLGITHTVTFKILY